MARNVALREMMSTTLRSGPVVHIFRCKCLPVLSADVPVVLCEEGGAADASREGGSPRSGGGLLGAVKNVLNKPKEAMQVSNCCMGHDIINIKC